MKNTLAKLMFAALLPLGLLAQSVPQITVTGSAVKEVEPNQLIITAGIEASSKSAGAVYENVATKMSKALAYLKDQKQVESFRTQMVRVNKHHVHNPAVTPEFSASQQLIIVLNDISFYDKLMIKLFDLGFNTVGSVTFGVDKTDELKREVQLKAIAVAKEKAAAFAKELGVELGAVIEFEEQNTFASPLANKRYGFTELANSSGPSIAQEAIEFQQTVIVSFAIK